jgi:hypothetical protein
LTTLMAVVMMKNPSRIPLDRALAWNQLSLAFERLMWLSLLLVPVLYGPQGHWFALVPWIIVSVAVVYTDLVVIREVWRDRLNQWWNKRLRGDS